MTKNPFPLVVIGLIAAVVAIVGIATVLDSSTSTSTSTSTSPAAERQTSSGTPADLAPPAVEPATPAPAVDVVVMTQADLDAHRDTERMRSLTIVGTDLTTLELPLLETIDVLTITDNASLATLELPMLKAVGVLRVQNNPRLPVDFTIAGTSEDAVIERNAGLSSVFIGQ